MRRDWIYANLRNPSWNHSYLERRAALEHRKYFREIVEPHPHVDDRTRIERADGEQIVCTAHVARPDMKRRHQGQIVVVHPARIDAKFSARRTSAEKHHSSAAPHSR